MSCYACLRRRLERLRATKATYECAKRVLLELEAMDRRYFRVAKQQVQGKQTARKSAQE